MKLPYEVQTDVAQRTIRYEGLFQKRRSYTLSTGVLTNEQRNSPRLVEMYLETISLLFPRIIPKMPSMVNGLAYAGRGHHPGFSRWLVLALHSSSRRCEQ